jgi:hypothetical protein
MSILHILLNPLQLLMLSLSIFNQFIIAVALSTFPVSHSVLNFYPALSALVSDADVCKAIKRLKPSKSVRLDDIPGFNIKCCSAIFIPILKHIFNLSLTQQYFPAAWKEAAAVPVFKRGNHAAMSNYRPISILNNFSKLFEFTIHDHVLHYAKFNPNQHGFTRTKSTVTNLVTDNLTLQVSMACYEGSFTLLLLATSSLKHLLLALQH